MRSTLVNGVESLSPGMRIGICAALIAVSTMLVGDEVRLQLAGEHVTARIAAIERVRSGRHGRHSSVRTELQFTTAEGRATACYVGDIHGTVGRMVSLRYLPPSHCAVAGDVRSIAMFGSFGLIGMVGLVWTLARRRKA